MEDLNVKMGRNKVGVYVPEFSIWERSDMEDRLDYWKEEQILGNHQQTLKVTLEVN